MTIINPNLADAIAAKGIPLSADLAPSSTERIVRDALGSVQGTVHHLGLVTLEVLAERLTEALQKHAVFAKRDHAPVSPAREAEIRSLEPAPPGLLGLGHHGSESERALYGRAVELHQACGQLLAEVDRLRAELTTARNPHTPRLCLCGHSHHAHTVPAPHSCFAYGQTCPCPQYRQLLPDEALAQLERNRRAAAERAREDEEAAR